MANEKLTKLFIVDNDNGSNNGYYDIIFQSENFIVVRHKELGNETVLDMQLNVVTTELPYDTGPSSLYQVIEVFFTEDDYLHKVFKENLIQNCLRSINLRGTMQRLSLDDLKLIAGKLGVTTDE